MLHLEPQSTLEIQEEALSIVFEQISIDIDNIDI